MGADHEKKFMKLKVKLKPTKILTSIIKEGKLSKNGRGFKFYDRHWRKKVHL